MSERTPEQLAADVREGLRTYGYWSDMDRQAAYNALDALLSRLTQAERALRAARPSDASTEGQR